MIGLWFVRLFFIFYLLLVLLGYTDIAFYFKPWLVPSLLLLFAANKFEYLNKKLVIALFFSTLGDVFLMSEGSLFFILGLSSFLIAHLAYISVFYELTKPVFRPLRPILDSTFFSCRRAQWWSVEDGCDALSGCWYLLQ